MLKKAEHKSRAMSISHVKMQEYLAKSFDQLTENKSGDDAAISQQFRDTQDNTYFNWTVNITEGLEGVAQIPFKNITVQTLYSERNPRNESVSNTTVRLSNVATYPLVHILSDGRKYTGAAMTLYDAPKTTTEYYEGMEDDEYNWDNITGNTSGVLGFNYRVPKDAIIMYNLAISYDTAHQPSSSETVYTRCTLDGRSTPPLGIITRTPIMTQVFINNILEIENIPAGHHTINVEWCHDSENTTVWLRAYDVTVLAVERK
jgi:hypothetical protein